jgi:hypothetical protein
MSENIAPGLIFERIALVMADIEAISKDRRNEQQDFKFRGIDDVYNELHPILGKHKVFTVPKIINRHYREKQTKGGALIIERILTIVYRFYTTDGSFIECEVDGEAMDMGDKATNKCMAIAHKYALLQIFCIPTEDDKDPDKTSTGPLRPTQNQVGPRPSSSPIKPKNGPLNNNSTALNQGNQKFPPHMLAEVIKITRLEKELGITHEQLKETLARMNFPASLKIMNYEQLKHVVKMLEDERAMVQGTQGPAPGMYENPPVNDQPPLSLGEIPNGPPADWQEEF